MTLIKIDILHSSGGNCSTTLHRAWPSGNWPGGGWSPSDWRWRPGRWSSTPGWWTVWIVLFASQIWVRPWLWNVLSRIVSKEIFCQSVYDVLTSNISALLSSPGWAGGEGPALAEAPAPAVQSADQEGRGQLSGALGHSPSPVSSTNNFRLWN